MTREELTGWIDLVYDAVDKSKLGPVICKGPNGQEGHNVLARDAMNALFNVVIPRPTAALTVSEPKQPWQE